MSSAWVASSSGLPCEGESVEFVLDNRSVAMDGRYVQQIFRSRWTSYDIQRVRTWRSSDACDGGLAMVRQAVVHCD